MPDTREQSNQAFDAFIDTYQAKYRKAAQCFAKERETLLSFYDYPAEHWRHICTPTPIGSTFATIRLGHHKTKGSGSRIASLTMMPALAENASKRWRLLNGSQIPPAVLQGSLFKDGIQVTQAAA
jgi:transposase-like protein